MNFQTQKIAPELNVISPKGVVNKPFDFGGSVFNMDVDGVVKKTEGITGTGTISKTIYESPFIQNICSGEEFFEVRPKTKISLSQMGEIASLVNKFDKENSEKSEHEEPEAVRFAKWVKDKTIPIGLNSEYVFVCDLNYKNAKRYTIEELYKLFKEQEK